MSEQPWNNGENGNGNGHEASEEKIALSQLQELKQKIESHHPPVRDRMGEVEAGIEGAMERNGVFLLLGETGSGKSIYSISAVRNVLRKHGLPDKIIVLQPRKDAAKGIAEAHAAVTEQVLGKDVGYSTSEIKMLNRDTPVHIVTSGILPRYLFQGTVNKENTGAIILDEVHEGSIDYHFVFGLLKKLREKGEAPFVLLTSATVEKEKLQKFFGFHEEDTLKVEGRTYPVKKKYLKEPERQGDPLYEDYQREDFLRETIRCAKEAIDSDQPGDILVFLPGVAEINEALDELSEIPEIEALPLYGGLSFEQRNRALSGERKRGAKRRVIVATNIAETSLTVPNITIVVDSCRKNSMVFDSKAGIYRKITELVSKAEADQRAGRGGRVAEGLCYRMISKEEYEKLLSHPMAEIERASLAHLILRLRGYGHDPETFPYFVEPKKEDLHAGVEQLKILGALDDTGEVTEIGKRMLHLPFRPEDSRMLVEAEDRNCKQAAILLALFAREQRLFVYPTNEEIDKADGWTPTEKKLNARKAIAESQAHFEYEYSDWHKRIKIFIEAVHEGGVFECLGDKKRPEIMKANKNFSDWCRMYHLNPESLKHVAYRLYEFSRAAGIDFDQYEFLEALYRTDPVAVKQSILAGYQERLLYKVGDGKIPEYIYLQKSFSGGINLSPDSSAFAFTPEFCVASSVSEGTGTMYGKKIKRNYASIVEPLSFEDVFELLEDKLEATPLGKPYYNYETQRVEQTFGYRMPHMPSSFGERSMAVDGEEAVRTFAEALVKGRVDLPVHYENMRLMQRVENIAMRSGESITVPDLLEWYVGRLGNVSSAREAKKMDNFLLLDIYELIPKETLEKINLVYPETIIVQGKEKKLVYAYGAGDPHFSIPSFFKVTLSLTEDELAALPPDTTFEVGEKGNRTQVQLEVVLEKNNGRYYREQEVYTGISPREIHEKMGKGEVTAETRARFDEMKQKLQSIVEEMKTYAKEPRKIGLGAPYFNITVRNLTYALDLFETVSDERTARENIEHAGRVIANVREMMETKKREVVEFQKLKTLYHERIDFLEEAIPGYRTKDPRKYLLYTNQIGALRRFILRSEGDTSYVSEFDSLRSISDNYELLKKMIREIKESKEADANINGTFPEAFGRAGRKKEKKKNEEQKAEEKEVTTNRGLETEMTAEIREEIKEEIEYLEAILDDVLVQAREVIDTSISVKSKRVEAAERILKKQELKRDLKDLRKEANSNEKPNVVRGHLGRIRDSIVSLLKANMHHIVPGYEKEWIEKFRELWDDAEKAVEDSKEAREYIEAGLTDKSRVLRDVRDLLRANVLSLQIGNEIRVSFEELIKQVLGKY